MTSFDSLMAYTKFLSNEKLEFDSRYNKRGCDSVDRGNFKLINLLGVGSYGKVVLVQDKSLEENFYAMKILNKESIVQRRQIDHTLSEKRVLQSLNFNFTVHLKYVFMDNSSLYFVMPFLAGGELFYHFKNDGCFPESQTQFYAAQILLALEYLHNFNLVYRDLKPENIIMDAKGYVKLADFGFCKLVTGRTYTLCGTPDYIAPEIITNKGHSKSADYWSLGVLIFELCAGFPPFMAPDLIKLYEAIVSGKFKHPTNFTKDLKDLTKRLLQTDLSKRLGNLKDGCEGVKNHSWFRSIHWLNLLNGEIESPFTPDIESADDCSNFDPYYTTEETRYYSESEDNLFEYEFSCF